MKTNNQKVAIAVLQEKIEEIDQKLSRVLDNHLPHIYEKLEAVDKRNAYFSGGIAVLIIMLEIILRFIK